MNKWDAIEKNDKTMREYEKEVRRVLSFMPYAGVSCMYLQRADRDFQNSMI